MSIDIMQIISPTEVIDLSTGERKSGKKEIKEKERKKKKEKRRYNPNPNKEKSEYEIDMKWVMPKEVAKELFSHEDLVFLRDASPKEQEEKAKEIVNNAKKEGKERKEGRR